MADPILPRSPMDLPTTRALLAERIERGEITQADVDLLKKGYRGMMTTTFLGSLIGIPVYIAMSRRRPRPALVTRLAAATFMASTGSFLGFTIGGAASALEVSTHMEDSQRKLKVFEEVMITSKRMAQEQRMPTGGRFPGSTTGSVGNIDENGPNSGVWDVEAAEKRQELEREREIPSSSSPDTSVTPGAITNATSSTWDRIRQESQQSTPRRSSPSTPSSAARQSGVPTSAAAPIDISSLPSTAPPRTAKDPLAIDTTTSSKYAPGMSVEAIVESEAAEERRREQEAFDRLLDKERNSAGDEGFEVGKWR
ncbi:hypothetical protein QFC19_006761 [Naganishia cerealis]|uniref:Uncharacterized protein n=1 Tax=Naganishia cerealis TaxID=610337 RepID=A0ACC2VE98_9TREE|nr:hypothetical protein QFC19_006761 [Naganishia cerealis]